MDSLFPHKQSLIPTHSPYIQNEFNIKYFLISHILHNELRHIQNDLLSTKSENESLKFIIKGLQSQSANGNKNYEALLTSNNDESQSIIKTLPSQPKQTQLISYAKIIDSLNANEKEDIFLQDTESTEKSEDSPYEENSEFMSPTINLKIGYENSEDGDELDSTQSLPIRRRNGFKVERNTVKEIKQKNKSKQKRSKAKHLWITYGRKIVDYAIENSEGFLKERIQQCDNLVSKKGYSEVFLLRSYDSEEEKDFKKRFSQLALDFLKSEVENAFLNSNYREELLSQKNKVQSWIEKQIKET